MAIFVSNLPESIGSSTQMHQGGKSTRYVLLLWLAIALVCVVSTWLGYLAASVTRGRFEGLVDGLAAGALLVMLVGAMIPEAQKTRREGGRARRRSRVRGGVGAGCRFLRGGRVARPLGLV